MSSPERNLFLELSKGATTADAIKLCRVIFNLHEMNDTSVMNYIIELRRPTEQERMSPAEYEEWLNDRFVKWSE